MQMSDEGVVSQEACDCACDTGWCVLQYAYENDGILVLVLFAIAAVFYKLVWKVWSAAMKAKDDEIDRITGERDHFQAKYFADLKSSDPSTFFNSGDDP